MGSKVGEGEVEKVEIVEKEGSTAGPDFSTLGFLTSPLRLLLLLHFLRFLMNNPPSHLFSICSVFLFFLSTSLSFSSTSSTSTSPRSIYQTINKHSLQST